MLTISGHCQIPEHELHFQAIRAQGPGGQHVNTASTAVQLRFDASASTVLPAPVKRRLLALNDDRIGNDGVITIKAQSHRSQRLNRDDALTRLQGLIRSVWQPPKKRIPTRPGKAAKQRRLDAKKQLGKRKQQRRPPKSWD